jgi:[ribosomal protein S5]-alanine N-acetyltransferase
MPSEMTTGARCTPSSRCPRSTAIRPTTHTEQASRDLIARAQREAACEPRALYELAVTRRGDHRLLGRGGFKRSGHELRTGELWCVLAPAEHGRGIVTEAARAVIELAFGQLGMHRLFGDCDPRNAASARLMERLGMRREAHHVQNLWAKGEWCDSWIYALLACTNHRTLWRCAARLSSDQLASASRRSFRMRK